MIMLLSMLEGQTLSLLSIQCNAYALDRIQESPANAKGTRDSSARMKAHCEQM